LRPNHRMSHGSAAGITRVARMRCTSNINRLNGNSAQAGAGNRRAAARTLSLSCHPAQARLHPMASRVPAGDGRKQPSRGMRRGETDKSNANHHRGNSVPYSVSWAHEYS
jgi:hypothetical protein